MMSMSFWILQKIVRIMVKIVPYSTGSMRLKGALKLLRRKVEMKITPDFLVSLKKRVKSSEGFRAVPYQDTLGIWTFGHGFTRIEEDESDAVLQIKLRKIIENDLPVFTQEIAYLNKKRLLIFIEMIYQLGVAGVKRFKNFRAACVKQDWVRASDEMLDSRWHTQTTSRCERLAKQFKEGE